MADIQIRKVVTIVEDIQPGWALPPRGPCGVSPPPRW